MSIFKLRVAVRYLIIPVLSWVISLFIAECVFRMLGDRATEDKQGYFMQFGNGSFKLLPHMDVGAKYASGPFYVHTDDLGLRCDAARKNAVEKGDSIDILFIGDSQGFGNGVNYEETIAGGVGEFARAKNMRVANASVGGHDLANQLELVRWLHEEQKLRVSRYIILLSPKMAMTSCGSFSRAIVGEDGRLYDGSKTKVEMAFIWVKTQAVGYARLRDAIRNIGIGVNPSSDVPFVVRIFDGSSDEEGLIGKLVQCLTEFRDLAARDGGTLSVVYVPLTVEADFAPVRKAGEARGLWLDRDLPMRVCMAAAGKLDVPLYNMRTVLEKAHSQGEGLHLKGDFHFDSRLSIACSKYLWQEIETSIQNNGDKLRDGRNGRWKSRR